MKNDFHLPLKRSEFIRGDYSGYKWLVIRRYCMGDLAGYVRLWHKHPLEKLWETEKYPYNKMNINCHGELIFSKEIKQHNIKKFPTGFTTGFWIGWDYENINHCIDRITETEVMEECKNVIDQLNNKYPKI